MIVASMLCFLCPGWCGFEIAGWLTPRVPKQNQDQGYCDTASGPNISTVDSYEMDLLSFSRSRGNDNVLYRA